LKGKYDKITNFNLSYENLLEAINDFDGFVTGLSHNDIILFNKTIMPNEIHKLKNKGYEDEGLRIFLKHIYSRILDRTTGAYQMHDMLSGNTADKYFKHVSNYFAIAEKIPGNLTDEFTGAGEGLGKYMHIVLPTQNDVFLPAGKGANVFTACSADTDLRMNKIIKYHVPTQSGLFKKNVVNDKGELQFDENNIPKQRWTTDQGNSFEAGGSVYINRDNLGSRFGRPSLGAFIMRHPKTSIMGRNKSHLPIFFNAITPVEMSRCTPYIKIEVVRQDFSNSAEKISNMNQVAYMRFTKGGSGTYELDDSIGFSNIKPVNSKSTLSERSLKESKTTKFSFMDIFNAPQTMANGDINKKNVNLFNLNYNNDDPVLDPITPMLSLNSLNVNITGAGFGLLASKKGSIKMTLHDRSRMRDLAPLLSSTQFATTKIIIEYGWNHPEGGVNSDNVIGKYLDGLKDRSVFQVVGTNFSFSDGNTVKIDVDLAAYGFRQNERIHCGSGPEVPLNVIEDQIKKVTSDLTKNNENLADAPELRQEIKLNSRNARSINSSISWQSYDMLSPFLKSGGSKEDLTDIIKSILIPDVDLYSTVVGDTESNESSIANEIKSAEEETEDQIARMIGKLEDIKSAESVDPYLNSTVTEGIDFKHYEQAGEDVVSLGKVISHFIGHPLASSCIYDEVQLVFYPLNHHAAGGRVHTTASLPIPIKKLESAIESKLEKTSNISVNSFFKLVEKIVRDRNISSYGLSSIFKDINTLRGKDQTTQLNLIKTKAEAGQIEGMGADDPDVKAIIEAENPDAIYNEATKDSIKKVGEERQKISIEIQEISTNIANLENENKVLTDNINKRTEVIGLLGVDTPPEEFIRLADDTRSDYQKISDNNDAKRNLERQKASKKLELEGNKNISDSLIRKKKTYDKLLKQAIQQETAEVKESVFKKCTSLYENDGLKDIYPAESKFVRPNLSMDFEVLEAIEAPNSSEYKFYQLSKRYQENQNSSNGHKDNVTILRVHIYDEEAVLDPAKYALHSSLVEGANNKFIGNKNYIDVLKEELGNLNYNSVKQIMKRSYPTIIYGASGTTIKNISVSANTSGELSNVLMVESYGKLRDGQVKGHSYESEFESITTLPNTVSVNMMGQPMIGRGNNIFIDFGTNTSLDNIYTVKSVSHSLSRGDFSTTVQLVPSNIGAISSFKDRMKNTLENL